MNTSSRTLVQLELETRPYHADLDTVWADLLAPGLTVARYKAHLSRVYGFEAPLEAALAYTPHLSSLIELRSRFRSGLIVEDLLALGAKPGVLAQAPQCMIAPFRGAAEALGWMYVLQRFTLRHDVTRGQLVSQLPEAAEATAYLAAYGASVGARWNDLGRTLDQVARTPQIEHQVLSSAHDAFRRALDWYDARARIARGA